MGKKKISSVENRKEAFWETALCSVNSSHRVTAFPSWSRSLRLFLWNLQMDIWKPVEAYGEKEIILRWKLDRRFQRNCYLMCDFHSLSYSCISWSYFLALFLWNLRTDISDSFEDYRAKGNIHHHKEKEVFWQTFFWSVNLSHRVTTFPSRRRSLRLFLWNWQRDIWKPIEAFLENENILRWKP